LRLLLDAPALLGVFFSSFRLGKRARIAIADLNNQVWICPASAYEIEWKRRIGKLQIPAVADWEAALTSRGYLLKPVAMEHFVAAANLPMHHCDPWDRLLIAQALADNLTIVSPDREFPAYGAPTLW
jgi:PIN domain nuclease of toxin-antitoxin system